MSPEEPPWPAQPERHFPELDDRPFEAVIDERTYLLRLADRDADPAEVRAHAAEQIDIFRDQHFPAPPTTANEQRDAWNGYLAP